ncbi:hypothetical protein KJA17_01860 [Patescibacteria group bacterium]|nr:hypothetical protein [Patescibacteria group bacterium]
MKIAWVVFILVLAVIFCGYIYIQGIMVRVTAYSPDVRQTDSSPSVTASGLNVKESDLLNLRYAAVHPKLKESLGLKWGDRIKVLVIMEFEIQDITSEKIKENTLDVFMLYEWQAKEWGIKKGWVIGIERRPKKKVKKK